MKKRFRKVIAFALAVAMLLGLALNNFTGISAATSSVTITESGGWFETAYAKWSPVTNADGYKAYYKASAVSSWTQIDDALIRTYASYVRVDAVGLSAGTYDLKIVPVINGAEDTSKQATKTGIAVKAYDRSGFAFVNGTASGAYNNNGTLKSNAVVLYITESTKNSVSMKVTTSSSGSNTSATGLQNILNAYKKGYDSRPLCIRLIGNITDLSTMEGGDIVIKGSGESKRLSCGITIEGIGEDAVANGWGLRIANASNVEVRNIGFMNCNSSEGDNVGLQQNNDHVWVHNCDFFYGDAGSDADQAKGDGALDTKTSTNITHSYNHFFDTGKSNLQGMKSESTENCITYHHNWYDHSDSRHPRVRTCTVHVYNNYYDGVAKYGIGATMGSSIFAENNYFRNTAYAMLISKQGSDLNTGDDGKGTFSGENGGMIKSYGNVIVGGKDLITHKENATSFDYYEASSRNEA
ncbi:MAG: pectate lyase, partial [Lachnospiraceae bacterium]|nr:pectate lyase [Lachnospiraceae bacterium]